MRPVLNIAACRFVDCDDSPALRHKLPGSTQATGLQGSAAPHWRGGCLVFDWRTALNTTLAA